jgi:hypothetical protein
VTINTNNDNQSISSLNISSDVENTSETVQLPLEKQFNSSHYENSSYQIDSVQTIDKSI